MHKLRLQFTICNGNIDMLMSNIPHVYNGYSKSFRKKFNKAMCHVI